MRISLIAIVLVLTACSSPQSNIQYYQLYQGMPKDYPQQSSERQIQLNRIALADYLLKTPLVVRTNDGALQYAKSHMWGSTLKHDVWMLMLDRLNTAANTVMYRQNLAGGYKAEAEQVNIRLEQMLPTEDGQVVIQASVWLIKDGTEVMHKRFSLRQPIDGIGYLAAVEAMRQGLSQLAGDIHTALMSEVKNQVK